MASIIEPYCILKTLSPRFLHQCKPAAGTKPAPVSDSTIRSCRQTFDPRSRKRTFVGTLLSHTFLVFIAKVIQ